MRVQIGAEGGDTRLPACIQTDIQPARVAVTVCFDMADAPHPDADIQAARKAAVSFDIRMKREITDRLERGEDPVAVYLAYADNVPGWGVEISNAGKIDFSRTAITVRNPANAPDAWETRQMELFNLLADGGQDPEAFEVAEIVQEGNEKVFRWMRPTVMGEACMTCHGEAVSQRIKLLLGQEYPLDDALGYSEGQLGGAYSVRKVLSVDGQPPPAYTPQALPPRLPADQRQPGDAPLVQPATPVEAQPLP